MKNRYQLSQTLQLSEIEKVYSITRPRYTYENEAEKYHVKIGTNPTCSCMYSSKSRAVCKHRLWVMLYVLNVPEESNVLQQVSLTTEEVKTVFSATVQAPTCNSTTQENESPQQTSTKSSQDTVSTQDIFSKHPMYQQPQVWKLSIFMKRSGKLPVCAGCRKNTIDDKSLHIAVKALYIPKHINFCVPRTYYFCVNMSCVHNKPLGSNLHTPPQAVQVDSEANITPAHVQHATELGIPIE